MTEREHAAYHAGICHAADLALIAELELELRDNAGKVNQRTALEALRGLAGGFKDEANDMMSNEVG